MDDAASRFRDDSEVMRLADSAGGPVEVSPLLAELVRVALQAASETNGAVDPTLGTQLADLGYDRDITEITDDPDIREVVSGRAGTGRLTVSRRRDWRDVRLNGLVLAVPRGVVLDLGATAKAWAADRSAARVVDELGGGVLVSLGGDIAVAGEEPEEGWTVLVQDGADQPSSLVGLRGAYGLATSSTLGRSWQRWNVRMHHILDPVTCRPVPAVWRTVSVAADTCVAANTLTTAALVRGARAVDLLRLRGVPARLVRADGVVLTLNGWPS